MVRSTAVSEKVILAVAQKIRTEIKSINSAEHDSILLDSIEALKNFSWESIWLELSSKTPTLVKLLQLLVTNSSKKKPLMSFIVCQLLKQQYPKLCLVQRAVSIALFGNGTSKQVDIIIEMLYTLCCCVYCPGI